MLVCGDRDRELRGEAGGVLRGELCVVDAAVGGGGDGAGGNGSVGGEGMLSYLLLLLLLLGLADLPTGVSPDGSRS